MSAITMIVVDETATTEQRDKLTTFLQQEPVSFWHHMSNVWLVAKPDEPAAWLPPKALKQRIREFIPNSYLLVFDIAITQGFSLSVPKDGTAWLTKHLAAKHEAD